MIKTTCLVVTFVAFITAEKASFENFKVFRIIPKNDEQLNMLKEFENYEGSVSIYYFIKKRKKNVFLIILAKV